MYMNTVGEAPQFQVEGLCSNTFYFDFSIFLKDKAHELLFVESILSILIDSFGDRFNASLVSKTFRENYTMIVRFQRYKWLWEFSKEVEKFAKDVNFYISKSDLRITEVYMTPSCDVSDVVRTFKFVVKDGTYEEKKYQEIGTMQAYDL